MLNEELMIQSNANQFGNIFRKIDIYNVNKNRLVENKFIDIRFTNSEQQAIKSMFRLIQEQIIRNNIDESLNEGFMDSIKSGAKTAVDKLKLLPDNIKRAYEFCENILNKTVSRVSELIKYFTQLLATLGDTVRDVIMKLGGFGKNSINEDYSYDNMQEDEKLFLSAVEEYVKQKYDDKSLNEGLLDKLEDKVSNNKFLEVILVGKYKGQKLSWWKTLLVSIVGSICVNLGVGFICFFAGIAAPTAATITSIVLMIWSLRNVLKVILNRKNTMKRTGENKFWNKAVVIQLVLTVGTITFFQLPAVKEFIGNLINAGLEKTSDWVHDKVNILISQYGGKEPSVEQIQSIIEESADTVTITSSVVNDNTVSSIKDKISEWMSGRAATGMAKAAGENLTINEPDIDVYVINGNANLINAFKAIKDQIEELGGQIVTSTSENNSGKTYLLDVIMPKGTDLKDLPASAINALKQAGADTTEFIKLENIYEEIPVPEPVVEIDDSIIDVGAYFGGFAFINQYKQKMIENVKLSLGSEPRMNQYVRLTDIKEMTFADAQSEVSKLGEFANTVGFRQLLKLDEISKGYTAKLATITNGALKEAEQTDKQTKKLVDAIKLNADPKKDKCLILFTSVKTDDKTQNIPIVAINYRTLYCVDMIKSKRLKSRVNPYFIKGLYNHLTLKPIKDNDTKTLEYIRDFLTDVLSKSALGIGKLCQATIGQVKKAFKKTTWVPKAEDNDKLRTELGNFSTAEFCDILNNPDECYKYFNVEYSTFIKGIDDNGNVSKTGKHYFIAQEGIEEKIKYVKENIIPVISCKRTDVFKELASDKLIQRFFMNNGNWRNIKNGDNNITIIEQDDIALALYCSPENFNKDTKKTIADYILAVFGKGRKNEKELAEASQRLANIIWKYKGDNRVWKKQEQIKNSEEQNTTSNYTDSDVDYIVVDDEGNETVKKKSYDNMYEWYDEVIIPRIHKDSEIYNDIKNDDNLKSYFLLKNGDVYEKRIKDAYLVAALYANREDTNSVQWDSVKAIIMKKSKKSKEQAEKIADKRVNRISKLYDIIQKYRFNTSESEVWFNMKAQPKLND